MSDVELTFDLDADGTAEQISGLRDGSMFLALDRNGDGHIGNGRELFGPTTGQGFAELAAYDADANGWIDENDPVFAQLKLWSGTDHLTSLKEGGVGAIHIQPVATGFDLTNTAGTVRARLTASDIYLKENGQAALIQQIDLVV
jgi:hypothetical protein